MKAMTVTAMAILMTSGLSMAQDARSNTLQKEIQERKLQQSQLNQAAAKAPTAAAYSQITQQRQANQQVIDAKTRELREAPKKK